MAPLVNVEHFIIIALQYSRRVFWFSFGHWLSTPWFFSRSGTRLVFSSFLPKKLFLFPLDRDSRHFYFYLLFLGVFCFFWIVLAYFANAGLLLNVYLYVVSAQHLAYRTLKSKWEIQTKQSKTCPSYLQYYAFITQSNRGTVLWN